jgi:superfamily II DNA/RNA helicase
VLIATPGRLLDQLDRGNILPTDIRLLVIDECDRMLDMGFIPDIERIVAKLRPQRQTLMFSATLPPEIRRLADKFLKNPIEVSVSPPASAATTVTQAMVKLSQDDKRDALRSLIKSEDVKNALVFCNRKRDVAIVHKSLVAHGFDAGALHGDMAQSARTETLAKFKADDLRIMVCSDVAARGIDIKGLSHVFNFDVPTHAEDYVHRIGRTGRAGREGRAFTLAAPDDRQMVEAIEKLTGHPIPRIAIEALDVVAWSEGDGRRRGRGRAAPAGKPVRRAPESRSGESRSGERKPAGRSAPRRELAEASSDSPAPIPSEAEWIAPAAAATPEPAAPQEARPPRGRRETSRRPEPTAAARPETARPESTRPESARPEPASRRHEGRRDEGRRPEGRGRGRDDDLGPVVRGFGDDVPAFMMVAARPNRAAPEAAAEETEV